MYESLQKAKSEEGNQNNQYCLIKIMPMHSKPSQYVKALSNQAIMDQMRKMREIQFEKHNVKSQIQELTKKIESNDKNIKYSEKVITFIHLQYQNSPIDSFKNYCLSLGIIHSETDQYEERQEDQYEQQSKCEDILDFQLTMEDQTIINKGFSCWHKSSLIGSRITQLQDDNDYVISQKHILEKRLTDLNSMHSSLLTEHKQNFEVDIKKFR